MELNILKIASDTSHNKILNNFTHRAYKKNPMCGDYIIFKIYMKKQIIEDISYESKSCIYCQASASLISKHFLKKKVVHVVKVIKLINQYYKNNDTEISGIMKKIFNKKNLKRKECIYLPIKALSGALKIENLFNQ